MVRGTGLGKTRNCENAKTAMGKMRKYVGENEVRKLGKLRKCENAIISV